MSSINPVGSGGIGPVQQPNIQQTSGTTAASSGSMVSSSMSMTSSTVSMSTVQIQVDDLLNSVGLDLENNQLLRMIIGLLLLEALLGAGGSDKQSSGGALLEQLNSTQSSYFSSMTSIQTETNVVQMNNMSSQVSSSQAVQSLSSGSEGNASGGQLDASA